MKTELIAPVLKTRAPAESGDASAQHSPDQISTEVRHRMIAAAAYIRAEQRGFQNGSPEADWLQAEIEVDEFLAQTQRARSGLEAPAKTTAQRRRT